VEEFQNLGLNTEFVQTNLSWNDRAGTLRGLHMQRPPMGEVKLVRCTRGAVYDVIVDLRSDSETFMKWVGLELVADKRNAIYVPEGFAHGYQALTDGAEVFYMVSRRYAPGYEVGYRWDDPAWRIEWPMANPVLSEKDASHGNFKV
jgi:dTDP-4-dehydrorhamnose 3,5-epimerase